MDKEYYIIMGYVDFADNGWRKFIGTSSWQAKCYNTGWTLASIDAASETQAQVIDLPYN